MAGRRPAWQACVGTMSDADKVEGYYWHVSCIYGAPGHIRDNDQGEPERGTFIDRAITMGHARRLDSNEIGSCHPCGAGNKRVSEEEDFVVLTHDLSSSLCGCGSGYNGNHGADRKLANKIWQEAPAKEWEKGKKGAAMEKLVCGDCWYKDNDHPPDERRKLPEPTSCNVCGDPVTAVVVLKGTKPSSGARVNVEELNEDDEYEVKVTWTRSYEVHAQYEVIVTDLDKEELGIIRNGEFQDIAWDIASDNSGKENEMDAEFNGYIDDGPVSVDWEVIVK